jgi:hypothetical protein
MGGMIADALACYADYMESANDRIATRKLFRSWKAYTLAAAACWLLSVILAGSVVGHVIMAFAAIPMVLATILPWVGVFAKAGRGDLIKQGSESLTAGIIVYAVVTVALAMLDPRTAPGNAVHSMIGVSGVMAFSLILAGIACLVRGARMPKTAER